MSQKSECSIRRLKSFVVLEKLTGSLRMVLSHQDGVPRSLADCLTSSIVRVELLVYNHFLVTTWQLEVLGLLKSKDVITPRLRQVRIEHWARATDDPASTFELEAGAVVSFGRQVGVDAQVDFVELTGPELRANGGDEEWTE